MCRDIEKKNTTTCYSPDKRPLTGASRAPGLRDKKRAIELHNPSPGRQCHKVCHDWLNKNTKSVEVPASHLGRLAPPLKGKASYFSLLWKFYK